MRTITIVLSDQQWHELNGDAMTRGTNVETLAYAYLILGQATNDQMKARPAAEQMALATRATDEFHYGRGRSDLKTPA